MMIVIIIVSETGGAVKPYPPLPVHKGGQTDLFLRRGTGSWKDHSFNSLFKLHAPFLPLPDRELIFILLRLHPDKVTKSTTNSRQPKTKTGGGSLPFGRAPCCVGGMAI